MGMLRRDDFIRREWHVFLLLTVLHHRSERGCLVEDSRTGWTDYVDDAIRHDFDGSSAFLCFVHFSGYILNVRIFLASEIK